MPLYHGRPGRGRMVFGAGGARAGTPVLRFDWAPVTPGPVGEAGPIRIRPGVLHLVDEIVFIADQVVIGFRMPELTSPVQDLIGLMCRERTPAMQDGRERVSFQRFENNMGMVWHDAVAIEPVADGVKMRERAAEQLGDSWIFEQALPVAAIEKLLDFLLSQLPETILLMLTQWSALETGNLENIVPLPSRSLRLCGDLSEIISSRTRSSSSRPGTARILTPPCRGFPRPVASAAAPGCTCPAPR